MSAVVRRILLAEDNPVNARLLVAVLEQSGFEVSVASDGARAVALATADVFDLILMDVNMPEIDGMEATRQIRAGALPGRDVPIFALTADDDGGTQRRCVESGMNGVITKPIEKAELLKALESVFNPRRRRAR